MLSHLIFREIQILNIELAVALQWGSVATLTYYMSSLVI